MAGRVWRTRPSRPARAAVAVWTGAEVLFLGGDTEPCPASASCVTPTVTPLADGAALDPSTGTWRRIADAPVGFTFADAEVVGDTVYVWTYGEPDRPGAPTAFLAVRPRDGSLAQSRASAAREGDARPRRRRLSDRHESRHR